MSIEERAKRASQGLLENSSLTDDLMDDEAGAMLDWALNMAQRFAQRTHYLDETQAEPVLEHGMKALRRTMRRMGRLVGRIEHLDPGDAHELMTRLLEAANQLPGVQVRTPEDVYSELQSLRLLPPGEMLQQLLTWLTLPEEE